MPFFVNRNLENQILEWFASMQSFNNARPVNLGGVSGPGGGGGGPPGGFSGQLIQTRVAYDTSEIAASGLPASGWSLLDNLKHIRYRLTQLENETVHQSIITFGGNLTVVDNPFRIYNRFGTNQTITEVFLAAGTPPSGSSVTVDIHKNGATIFTDQNHRPTIVSGNYTGYTTDIDVNNWDTNEYITAHIDAIGTTVAGADLVVHVIHN